MAFSQSSTNIQLQGSDLVAQCRDMGGSGCDSRININNYIANYDGTLAWHANGNFAASTRNMRVEGGMLYAESQRCDGSWISSQINLDEKITNFNGKMIYVFERAIIHVDANNKDEVTKYLQNYLEAHKEEVSTEVADGGDYKVIYIEAGAGKDEGLILQVSAEAQASVFHAVGKDDGIATVNLDILQAKAEAWTSMAGAGVGVSANLVDAHASVFDLTLGVGIDTGAGIHDDSFEVKALGCGFTLGRKVGISVFGSSFGVDFGRCSVM